MINHSTWIFLPEAIMNYATVYYQLQNNPCKQAGTIGKSDADAMQIWTLDRFERFIDFEDKAAGWLAFNVFFWTGIHERELLALTIEDFTYNDVEEYRLNIDKNFEVVKGIQYLLTPKTDSSRRCLPYRSFYTTRSWTIITPYMSRIHRRACFILPRISLLRISNEWQSWPAWSRSGCMTFVTLMSRPRQKSPI